MNLHKLKAGAVEENKGCIRAFQKAGYSITGIEPDEYYCDGEYKNVVRMSKLKGDTN